MELQSVHRLTDWVLRQVVGKAYLQPCWAAGREARLELQVGEGRAYLPEGILLPQVLEVGKVVRLVVGKASHLEEERGMGACLDRRGLAYRQVHRMVVVAYHPEERRMVEECR